MTDTAILDVLGHEKCEIVFSDKPDEELPHPNTMVFEAFAVDGGAMALMEVYSVGGGRIVIKGRPAEKARDVYKLSTFGEIKAYCEQNHMRICDYVYETEGESIKEYLTAIWQRMKQTIEAGLAAEGILQGGLEVQRKARYLYRQNHIDESPQKMCIRDRLIAGSKKITAEDAIEIGVDVPGGKWKLAICPTEGWISNHSLAIKAVVALLIDILAALLAFYFVTSERQKKGLDLLANTDPMTRLYNERYLTSKLKTLIHRETPFGLYYLDLNKFKVVNDSYGHDVGDKLLIAVAERIQDSIRDEDYACRIGGDEFAVIISADYEDAEYDRLRKSIKKAVEAPFAVDEIHLYPTVSCGYARYPHDEQSMDRLIKIADQRMYREKMASNKDW